MPQCHKPQYWYLKHLFHEQNQYVGAAQSCPENKRSPCRGVILRSGHAKLQKLTESSHGWKLRGTNITKTSDLCIPLSCPSSEIVTKYFFHCFLNFVRLPNRLNFFTCFCKSLFELLCFFLLTVQAFQILLKVWSFPKLPDFLENWHFLKYFTNLPVNCLIRTSFCDYTFVCKTQKETVHPSVTYFSIKLEKMFLTNMGDKYCTISAF